MNKEEILSLSRKQKSDEGLACAENNGRKLAHVIFTFTLALVMLMEFFHGRNISSLFVIFFAFVAAEQYPIYRFTQKKRNLYGCILNCSAALINLIILWRSYGR